MLIAAKIVEDCAPVQFLKKDFKSIFLRMKIFKNFFDQCRGEVSSKCFKQAYTLLIKFKKTSAS
jgi:hypothetical protein